MPDRLRNFMRSFWNKYENFITAALTILVNMTLAGICFDYYYDLNDDVMMKDVMAGVYAGTPDGHNMQTLYMLGAFISLCYRICRTLPWYGIFLCLCQGGSLFLISVRLLRLCKSRKAKAGAMAFVALFIWGVLLPHMVAVQYTLACTMLAMAAVFLFLTTEKGLTLKRFVINNIPSILLVFLAYQLRSEMLLLVFPLICLAGLYRWAAEEKFFCKENYIKYGAVIAAVLAGLLVSRVSDAVAYSSGGWKEAVNFFDERTKVYDFHYDVLTSGEHREYLASIGLGGAKQELLANYNFGLAEDIDAALMGEIADYAEKNASRPPLSERIIDGGRSYIYRTLHREDSPYNIIAFLGYVCVLISGVHELIRGRNTKNKKRPLFLWELILLVMVRSVLWMYIMVNGRSPERITHSLYLAEIMLLFGMICMQGEGFARGLKPEGNAKRLRNKPYITPVIFMCGTAALCIVNLPKNIAAVAADAQVREEANRGAAAIAGYAKAHPENFYFEDVYSTVGFSQKMFKNVDNSFTNYDIMGGWMCKTPLYDQKLRRFGIESTSGALLGSDGVYFIIEKERAAETVAGGGTAGSVAGAGEAAAWLTEYYREMGIETALNLTDIIDDKYLVYQVIEE